MRWHRVGKSSFSKVCANVQPFKKILFVIVKCSCRLTQVVTDVKIQNSSDCHVLP